MQDPNLFWSPTLNLLFHLFDGAFRVGGLRGGLRDFPEDRLKAIFVLVTTQSAGGLDKPFHLWSFDFTCHYSTIRTLDDRYSYLAFIDEAGDPGLHKVKPRDPDGASEWMTLGAVIINASDEDNVVQWVKDIRAQVRDNQGPALHFRNLSDERKRLAVAKTIEFPMGGIAVVSHKPNMRRHLNPRAAAYLTPRGWFYNWMVRLVLERVTEVVHHHSIRKYGEPRTVKLVFSERGGVLYDWIQAYLQILKKQAENSTTYLKKGEIKPSVLNTKLLEVVPSSGSAGCQIADIFASAFHCAADANGNRWNTVPAKLLRPRMLKKSGSHAGFGVTLQPTPFFRTRNLLSQKQKEIFHYYGY